MIGVWRIGTKGPCHPRPQGHAQGESSSTFGDDDRSY
jgi:hypothetical protein